MCAKKHVQECLLFLVYKSEKALDTQNVHKQVNKQGRSCAGKQCLKDRREICSDM